MYIPVILGTAREGRRSEKVAEFVYGLLKKIEPEVELVDVRDHLSPITLPSWEDHPETSDWKAKAEKADAYVIVSPEYNHSFPGELKIMLDGAYEEYDGKPVMVVTVSKGEVAGARLGENILHYLVGLGMYPHKGSVRFGNVNDLFDEDNKIKDASMEEKVNKAFELLLKRAGALKTIR